MASVIVSVQNAVYWKMNLPTGIQIRMFVPGTEGLGEGGETLTWRAATRTRCVCSESGVEG
eukprot:3582551-Rhodomonas_salina.1